MSGSIEGGKKAAKTNIEKHGADFYAKIGRSGGKVSNPYKPKGFAYDKELASKAGAKGGTISRRKPSAYL